jgi:hypothetical protein
MNVSGGFVAETHGLREPTITSYQEKLNFRDYCFASERGQEAHLVQDKVADSAVTQVCRNNSGQIESDLRWNARDNEM